MHYQRLPQDVRNNCLRGLSLMRSAPATVKVAPPKAQQFAATLKDGFPPDPVMARECVDAHIALDNHIVDNGPNDYTRIVSLLWGGEEGRDYAQQVLEIQTVVKAPEPQLVAADLDNPDDELAALCEALNRITERTRNQIETAARMAYLAALRQLTRQASRAVMATMNKTWREQVGDEIVDMRASARALYEHNTSPYVAASLVPEPVMAVLTIDQQTIIEEALEDLDVTARQILSNAHDDTIAALAASLDTTEAEIRAELQNTLAEQRNDAAQLLAAAVLAFTLTRADRTDGEVADSLENAVIPVAIVNDVTNVAGGAARVGTTTSRTADGTLNLVDGTQTQVEGVTSFLMNQTVNRVLGAVPITRQEWVYGSPSERQVPRVDHQRLDGLRWTGRSGLSNALQETTAPIAAEDVAPDVYPGSLPGCKCQSRLVGIGLPGSFAN